MHLSALQALGGAGFAIKITISCAELDLAGVSIAEFDRLLGDIKNPLPAPGKIALLAAWAQRIEAATNVNNLPPDMKKDAHLAISAGLCPDCTALSDCHSEGLSDCHSEGCPQDAEGGS